MSEAGHQLAFATTESSEAQFMDIDSIEPNIVWEVMPTDHQGQPCGREFVVDHHRDESPAMAINVELRGADVSGPKTLDNGNGNGGRNAVYLSSTSAVAAATAGATTAASTAQEPGTSKTQWPEHQHRGNQNDLHFHDDAATSVDVEASDTVTNNSAPQNVHVAKPVPVIHGEQDGDEHEIDNIIGKEEINGETYYLVKWTPTLMPLNQLSKARDLVDRFEARRQRQHLLANGQRKRLKSSRGGQAIAKTSRVPEKPLHLVQLLAATGQAQHGTSAEIRTRRRGRPSKARLTSFDY